MKNNHPFPHSLCRQMCRNYLILSAATAIAAIIGTAATAATLYGITKKPSAALVIIALLSLIVADMARCHAIKQIRSYKLWKSYLRDSQPASPCSHLPASPH